MAIKKLPDLDVLRLLLDPDFDSGEMTWRERPLSMFLSLRACMAWNGRNAGAKAFKSMSTAGYYSGRIFRGSYFAHRVIWAMVNDRHPTTFIDHINGDRLDNRPSNLREATPSQNGFNSRLPITNTSGFKGAFQVRSNGRWYAKIEIDGKQKYLGSHATAEDAARAYDAAARAARGDFARTNGTT